MIDEMAPDSGDIVIDSAWAGLVQADESDLEAVASAGEGLLHALQSRLRDLGDVAAR